MNDTLSQRVRAETLILTNVLRTDTALTVVYWIVHHQIKDIDKGWFMGRIDFLAHHKLLKLKLPRVPSQDHIGGVKAKKIGQIPNDERGLKKFLNKIHVRKRA